LLDESVETLSLVEKLLVVEQVRAVVEAEAAL
jgi:hypothetical protein